MRPLLALLTAAFVLTALSPGAGASHVVRLPANAGVDAWASVERLVAPTPAWQVYQYCWPWCQNLTTLPSTAEGPVRSLALVTGTATPEVCNPALIGTQAHCYHAHFGCYEMGRGQWACWHGLLWCDSYANGPLPGDVHLGNPCTHA